MCMLVGISVRWVGVGLRRRCEGVSVGGGLN